MKQVKCYPHLFLESQGKFNADYQLVIYLHISKVMFDNTTDLTDRKDHFEQKEALPNFRKGF